MFVLSHAIILTTSSLYFMQSGSKGYKKPVLTRCTSIQGEWHERMDLIGLELKVIEK